MTAIKRIPGSVFAGVVAVAAIVLITYSQAYRIGYYFNEDYEYLLRTHAMSLWRAMGYFFDPRQQWRWYRPLYGLLIWALDGPLGASPSHYHVLSLVAHFGNSLMLWVVVSKATRKTGVGLLAALVFSVLPVYRASPWWPLDSGPLADSLCLVTVFFWINYLDEDRCRDYIFALIAYTSAILTKETSAILIGILFLSDRLLVGKQAPLPLLVRRYALPAVLLGVYLGLELSFQTRGMFAGIGYSLGLHVVANLVGYIGTLAAPWRDEPASIYWTAAIIGLLLLWWSKTHSRRVLFLGLVTLLCLLPVLPVKSYEFRYLYTPAMPISVLLAGLILSMPKRIANPRAGIVLVSVFVTAFLVYGAGQSAQAVEAIAGVAVGSRVPFREIAQKYPTLPTRTLLYFIGPPVPEINLAGMSLLRYGDRVALGSTETDRPADLAEHPLSLVFYQNRGQERVVRIEAGSLDVESGSGLVPRIATVPIRLTGVEMVNPRVQAGDNVVVLMYWQATQRIAKDYTVFVHLIDGSGNMVGGADHPPGDGKKPTTGWAPGKTVVDWAIVPIDAALPPGSDYKLEIGLYDLRTMERLEFLNEQGAPVFDKIEIGPLEIIP